LRLQGDEAVEQRINNVVPLVLVPRLTDPEIEKLDAGCAGFLDLMTQ
jgi:hypothetical protein